MADYTRDAVQAARKGGEFEAALNHPVIEHLLAQADAEAAHALDKLAEVEPTDTEKVRELQNAVWRARSINGWIQSVIANGKSAHRYLVESEA